MADYDLYYWSVPFRGQFVRAVLAHAGKSWIEGGDDAIADMMAGPVVTMPVPFMGPPILVDRPAGVAVAQMPAIVPYLGDTLGLMPATAALRALTIKTINDANDVLDDLTLDGGRQMWTDAAWDAFVPRLRRWMSVFEETGRRHGLGERDGVLPGGEAPGIADVVAATLWSTMATRLPKVGAMLDEAAPRTAALARRVAAPPPLADLDAQARRSHGDGYCGGQIEASLRRVLGG